MNRIIFIMGVSGSGKTTIGRLLSEKMGVPFFDGDNFHSPANKEKMRAGIPLTDEDRRGWLQQLNAMAQSAVDEGAIIGCSALKEKYRDLLSDGIADPVWVFLQGDYNLIQDRMETRHHEYMPATLLQSQFDTLEPPQTAVTIDISMPPQKIIDIIIEHIER